MARSSYERKAQAELEADNWKVDWKIKPSGRRMPRGYNVDYFGLFDLLCYKAGKPLRWISIKGTQGLLKKHIEEIKGFRLPADNQKEVWAWAKRRGGGWNKLIFKGNEWEIIKNEKGKREG